MATSELYFNSHYYSVSRVCAPVCVCVVLPVALTELFFFVNKEQ